MLDAKACIDLLLQQQNLVILDARPADEFDNKSATSYKNVGRLKGAINLPSLEALEIIIRQTDKSKPFLIYGSNTFGTIVCQELTKKGFRQVYLLSQGFYHFVWSTANIENCKTGKAYLNNHEGLY